MRFYLSNLLLLISSFMSFVNGQNNFSTLNSNENISVSPGFSELEKKYDLKHYFLDIEADNDSSYISSQAIIFIKALEKIDTIVFELSEELSIDSTLVNQVNEKYIHDNELVYIIPNKIILPNELVKLKIAYHGSTRSNGFFAGIATKIDYTYDKMVSYTLSEPFNASKWFPVKQDLTDKADSVRVHISVDEGLMAGSNGILQNIENLGNGKIRYEWFSSYPIAYYLISFTVADYLDYSFYVKLEGLADSLLVQNFIYNNPEILNAEKENIDKTADLLKFFSDIYGLYPFSREKYGHCMAPLGGGMEHQTMTTIQSFNFELIAHELAHQWFGDYLTCASWQDIWINEGFASYSEYLALENLKGDEFAQAWMDKAHNIAMNSPEGKIFLTKIEAGIPNRIFDYSLSYKKGASIIHMLRYEMNNDPLFFLVLKKFIEKYKYSVASVSNFIEMLNSESDKDYNWFFDQWYYGRGYPVFQISYKKTDDRLYLFSEQYSSSDTSQFFKTHFDIRINYQNGEDTLIRLLQDEKLKNYSFPLKTSLQSIDFDPFSHLLMKSLLYEKFPDTMEVELSPNPFRNDLYLNFLEKNTNKEILIANREGKIVFTKKNVSSESVNLKLSFLQSGLYILIINSSNKKITKKILKL